MTPDIGRLIVAGTLAPTPRRGRASALNRFFNRLWRALK
jgi:hypothetical protein